MGVSELVPKGRIGSQKFQLKCPNWFPNFVRIGSLNLVRIGSLDFVRVGYLLTIFPSHFCMDILGESTMIIKIKKIETNLYTNS